MDPSLKEMYKKTFDTVSEGYGNSAMRFFSLSADNVSGYLNLNGDEHVLDVATGTGAVALALAGELPAGHVTGIDFSEGMLAQAKKRLNERGINNITFSCMDMQAMEFQPHAFDAAVSAFSIFFVEDMRTQLIHISEKVKPGGTVMMTTFPEDAFIPLTTLLYDRLERYGIEVPSRSWTRVSTKTQCEDLFVSAGLSSVRVDQKNCGYYLTDASDWWYIVWNGGFRSLVSQVPSERFETFKEEHMEEINSLASDKGIWLDMNILYTTGITQNGHV